MALIIGVIAAAVLQASSTPLAPQVFQAVLAERAAGFESLAECEKALDPSSGPTAAGRGSLFNRTAGNISRCEMVKGEPSIVVVPNPPAF